MVQAVGREGQRRCPTETRGNLRSWLMVRGKGELPEGFRPRTLTGSSTCDDPGVSVLLLTNPARPAPEAPAHLTEAAWES